MLLTNPTPAESDQYFRSRAPLDCGKIWDGIRMGIDSIADPRDRQKAIDAIKTGLEDYQVGGSSAFSVTMGTLSTDGLKHLDTTRAGDIRTLAGMNRAARSLWPGR